jgi:hypothetical protein
LAKTKNRTASFLFSDQFSKYNMDSVNNTITKSFQSGTWARATTGFYLNNTFHHIGVTAAAYYQFGKTSYGQQLSAGLLSGFVQYLFDKKTSAGAGIDFTSRGTTGTTSNNLTHYMEHHTSSGDSWIIFMQRAHSGKED